MIPVNVDNFARAETDRMFSDLAALAGGTNRWFHFRQPTPIDNQTVIRMNRDTLYSACIVDLAGGGVLVIPDAGKRYLSVMVVNEDHYVNRVFHDPGEYTLTTEEFGTRFVLLAARTLVNDRDAADIAAVHALQDGITLRGGQPGSFVLPEYDKESFDATRSALLALAQNVSGLTKTFGRKDEVDPVHHLIGSAMGWGGLPDSEALYINVSPELPVGRYRIDVPADVPVDAFWSVSVYNADGFFEKNDRDMYVVNSVSGVRNPDGSMTVYLGDSTDKPNCVPIVEGWNYVVRLYRPRAALRDGSWTFPALQQGWS